MCFDVAEVQMGNLQLVLVHVSVSLKYQAYIELREPESDCILCIFTKCKVLE